jgi:hypothetical protein
MQYFYVDAKRQPQGPVSREKLTELLERGELTPASLIAVAGSQNWAALSSLLGKPPALDSLPERLAVRSRRLGLASIGCYIIPLILIMSSGTFFSGYENSNTKGFMALGLFCIIGCSLPLTLAAIIYGHLARKKIKHNLPLGNVKIARGSLIIGYCMLTFWAINIILIGCVICYEISIR